MLYDFVYEFHCLNVLLRRKTEMLQVLTVLVCVIIIKLMKKVNLHQTMKLLPYNLEFCESVKNKM